MLKNKKFILTLLILALYVIAKIYVLQTPTTQDDDVPELVTDQVFNLLDNV